MTDTGWPETRWRRGDDSHTSKLTEKQVRIARRNYKRAKRIAEKYSCKAMAERAGVSQGTMQNAVKGLTWKHVK